MSVEPIFHPHPNYQSDVAFSLCRSLMFWFCYFTFRNACFLLSGRAKYVIFINIRLKGIYVPLYISKFGHSSVCTKLTVGFDGQHIWYRDFRIFIAWQVFKPFSSFVETLKMSDWFMLTQLRNTFSFFFLYDKWNSLSLKRNGNYFECSTTLPEALNKVFAALCFILVTINW